MDTTAPVDRFDQILAENSTLTEFSPKHSVWDKRKSEADVIAEVYDQSDDNDIQKHAHPVRTCSDILFFTVTRQEIKANSFKCRERHCPICQSARAMRFHREFKKALPAIMGMVPGGRFLMLTLTVANCPITELRSAISQMNKSFRRMLRKPDLEILRGWLRSTEVTRSANSEAHPHFHVLLLVPPSYFTHGYITQARWTELWRCAARLDYDPIVDIRRVKGDDFGLSEVVKAATYSVKPSELHDDAAWFHELHRQVRGLRFIAAGGVIKAALKLDDEPDADIVEATEGIDTTGIVLFQWKREQKQYRSI